MSHAYGYNAMELMICCAARLLEDGAVVAVGTGIPCAAAMLAQKTGAPGLVVMFEAGGIAPRLPTMPISVGDSRTFHQAVMATSMADMMETCTRGLVDYAFLGGAQIDPHGNLNSTQIGADHASPRVRLPGSGGACDLASVCWRVIVVTNHDRRRFVEKLDFLTTPGFLDGPGSREAAGLPPARRQTRTLTADLRSAAGTRQFLRGRALQDGRVEVVGGPSSHLVAGLAASDLLLDIPGNITELKAGDPVETIDL